MRLRWICVALALALVPLPIAGAQPPLVACQHYSDAEVQGTASSATALQGPGGIGGTASSGEGVIALGLETARGDTLRIVAAGYGGLAWRLVAVDGPRSGDVLAEGAMGASPEAAQLVALAAEGGRVCFEAQVLPTSGSAAYAVQSLRETPVAFPLPNLEPPAPLCVGVETEEGPSRLCAPAPPA